MPLTWWDSANPRVGFPWLLHRVQVQLAASGSFEQVASQPGLQGQRISCITFSGDKPWIAWAKWDSWSPLQWSSFKDVCHPGMPSWMVVFLPLGHTRPLESSLCLSTLSHCRFLEGLDLHLPLSCLWTTVCGCAGPDLAALVLLLGPSTVASLCLAARDPSSWPWEDQPGDPRGSPT